MSLKLGISIFSFNIKHIALAKNAWKPAVANNYPFGLWDLGCRLPKESQLFHLYTAPPPKLESVLETAFKQLVWLSEWGSGPGPPVVDVQASHSQRK